MALNVTMTTVTMTTVAMTAVTTTTTMTMTTVTMIIIPYRREGWPKVSVLVIQHSLKTKNFPQVQNIQTSNLKAF